MELHVNALPLYFSLHCLLYLIFGGSSFYFRHKWMWKNVGHRWHPGSESQGWDAFVSIIWKSFLFFSFALLVFITALKVTAAKLTRQSVCAAPPPFSSLTLLTPSSTNTLHYGVQNEAVIIELQRGNSFGSIENPFWINFVEMQQAGRWTQTQWLPFQVRHPLAVALTTFRLYDCFFWQDPK